MKIHKQRLGIFAGALLTAMSMALPVVTQSCVGDWCIYIWTGTRNGLQTVGIGGLLLCLIAMAIALFVGGRHRKMPIWAMAVSSASIIGVSLLLLTKLGTSGSGTVISHSLTAFGYAFALVTFVGPGLAFWTRNAPDLTEEPVKNKTPDVFATTVTGTEEAVRHPVPIIPTIGEACLFGVAAGLKYAELNDQTIKTEEKMALGLAFLILCIFASILVVRRAWKRARSGKKVHELHVVRDFQMATACLLLGPILGLSLKMQEHDRSASTIAITTAGVVVFLSIIYFALMRRERMILLGVFGVIGAIGFLYFGFSALSSDEATSILTSLSSMGRHTAETYVTQIRYLGGTGLILLGISNLAFSASVIVHNAVHRALSYRVLYGAVAGSALLSAISTVLNSAMPEHQSDEALSRWLGETFGVGGAWNLILTCTGIVLMYASMRKSHTSVPAIGVP
jgi:hypothetical protein